MTLFFTAVAANIDIATTIFSSAYTMFVMTVLAAPTFKLKQTYDQKQII